MKSKSYYSAWQKQ